MGFKPGQKLVMTIRPNIRKIFLKNFLTIFGIALLIAGILWFLNLQVGLGVFLEIFEVFGIAVSQPSILHYSILAVVAASCLLLAVNYIVNANSRYEFYQSRLVAYINSGFVFTNSREIPYENVARVGYNNNGIFNSIFNSGTIVLETSGMGSEKMELKFIDDAPQAAQSIQEALQEFQSVKQAQFSENYKIDNLMNRYE